jgi:hypothetical protein
MARTTKSVVYSLFDAILVWVGEVDGFDLLESELPRTHMKCSLVCTADPIILRSIWSQTVQECPLAEFLNIRRRASVVALDILEVWCLLPCSESLRTEWTLLLVLVQLPPSVSVWWWQVR